MLAREITVLPIISLVGSLDRLARVYFRCTCFALNYWLHKTKQKSYKAGRILLLTATRDTQSESEKIYALGVPQFESS